MKLGMQVVAAVMFLVSVDVAMHEMGVQESVVAEIILAVAGAVEAAIP